MTDLSSDKFAVKESPCPTCGAKLDGALAPANIDARPKPGDFTLCVMCKTPAVYADDMTLRAVCEADKPDMPMMLLAMMMSATETPEQIH